MNLQENIQRIKQVMGINEQTDIISKYVSDPRLISILKNIETTLGDKFTDQHFKTEIQYSGGLKQESGGLLPEVRQAFEKMKQESGCPDIFIKEDKPISYRSYEDQKDQFLQEASKYTQNKITNALKRVAIPGFSQHHTGKSIDYGGNTICLRKNAWPKGDYSKPNKWGFTLPYMLGVKRMEEPWHLYYVGTNNNVVNNNSTIVKDIVIKGTDLKLFGEEIAKQTASKSLDLSSIKLDMDKKTFNAKVGQTPVLKLVLRWNLPGEQNCISCENTINKNPEYRPEILKDVRWDNNKRIGNLIVLYPQK